MIKEAIQFYKLRSEWLGEGGHPVSIPNAQTRADVCLKCPMNDATKGLYEVLASSAALLVRRQIELKNRMSLRVDGEKSLHICSGCLCVLKLKVWVPIKFIEQTTDMTKLHPDCWQLKEVKQ